MGPGAFQRDTQKSSTNDSAAVKLPRDMGTRHQTRQKVKHAIKQLKLEEAPEADEVREHPEFFKTTTETSNTLVGKSSTLK